MKKSVLFLTLFSFGFLLSQQREDMNLMGERQRVKLGIQSGEINQAEAKLIKTKARQLKRSKRHAKIDGVITPRERAKIARKDAKLDRTIRRTKHN